MGEREKRKAGSGLGSGQERRILKRADFKATYDGGRKAHGRYATIFARTREEAESGGWRLGITATRKTGNAPERNRHRRRVREYFRLNQREIKPGWDIVVNARTVMSEATHEELGRDLERTLGRLGLWAKRPGQDGERE